MTTSTLPPRDDRPRPAPEGRGRRVLAVLATLVAVAVLVLAFVLRGDGPEPVPAPPVEPQAPPSAAAPNSPAPEPVAPVPTAAPRPEPEPEPTTAREAPAGHETAVWPHAVSEVRYATPTAAARGFATGLVGFRDPVVGPFQAGDANSGEVEVRPQDDGPVTTVLVRRLADGTWWVLGAATADVRLTSPGAGDTVADPLAITGEALAFEGHVTVRLLQDGRIAPLATTFVTGGGDVARPFTGTVDFPAPDSRYGALVLTTESAQDGRVWTASVLRVRFAPAG